MAEPPPANKKKLYPTFVSNIDEIMNIIEFMLSTSITPPNIASFPKAYKFSKVILHVENRYSVAMAPPPKIVKFKKH